MLIPSYGWRDLAVLFAHPFWHLMSALSHGLWMKYVAQLVLEVNGEKCETLSDKNK
jgi:hypothetical protein